MANDPAATNVVHLGDRAVRFGGESSPGDLADHGLGELRDSTALYRAADYAGLRERLQRDGYLRLRGVIPRDSVLAARAFLLQHFEALGGILDVGTAGDADGKDDGGEDGAAPPPAKKKARRRDQPLVADDAVLLQRCGFGCVPFMEGKNDLTHSPPLLGVVENDALLELFRGLFDLKDTADVRTFDYKWLRGVYRQAFTGVHVDNVYMSRGSRRLHTCWVPLGDTPPRMGTLALAERSHALPCFARLQETYGAMDTEAINLDGTGWFTKDPFEIYELFRQGPGDGGAGSGAGAGSGGGGGAGRRFEDLWKTSNFCAGDVVVFGLHTLHMSTRNDTDRVRLSVDVRFQPRADAVDPRYAGAGAGEKRKRAGLNHGDGGGDGGGGDGDGAAADATATATATATAAAPAAAGAAAAAAAAAPAPPPVTIEALKAAWGFLQPSTTSSSSSSSK